MSVLDDPAGYGVIDDLSMLVEGPHPVRLAGAEALLPDLTAKGLLNLIDAVRQNALKAGIRIGVNRARKGST